MRPAEQHGFCETSFFQYTSGRWLWDEADQLRRRYQPFNIVKLKDLAARSVNASSCVDMIKLPEGFHNKCFLLTMDNGVQVVARIPNPFLPRKVETASEVATLDFLRNELNIPVPKVYAWSSGTDEGVGVEYIVMEKASGEEFSKCWPTMDISDKVDIVSQLANIQAKISSVDWSYHGSLYYRDQIDGCRNIPGLPERFSIGPITSFDFWERERMFTEKYKGPWSTASSYITNIAEREKDWIRRFAKSRDTSDPLRQSDAQESPDCHLQLLDKYLKVAPYVLPTEKELHRPTLSHPDLHVGNIFIEKNQIVSIIDWQASSILPLFLTCKIPKFLRINGPLLFDLPPATGLTAREKEENLARYQLTRLQRVYVSKLHDLDEKSFRALSDPYALTRQQLVDFAGSTWEDDGLFLFREMLHRTWRDWEEITGQRREDCPITFSSDESLSQAEEGKGWNKYREFFNTLGIPMDGWIHPEAFESKVETMRELAAAVIKSAENKEEAKAALRAWKLTESKEGSRPGDAMEF